MKNDKVENDDVLIVKEIIAVDDGRHIGVISGVIKMIRKDYEYIDIMISLKDEPLETLKVGFPATISNLSGLGKLLKASGMTFEGGQIIKMKDIRKQLIGRKVVCRLDLEIVD